MVTMVIARGLLYQCACTTDNRAAQDQQHRVAELTAAADALFMIHAPDAAACSHTQFKPLAAAVAVVQQHQPA